ncbi:Ig-like domain-containing protein [uncultured Friedmanniella sp.]|uniref:L,D-transpeptidase n=1 Tax=uncultured Friedmanniella sp. TaxID=335381 RepID=UPI0035CAF66B
MTRSHRLASLSGIAGSVVLATVLSSCSALGSQPGSETTPDSSGAPTTSTSSQSPSPSTPPTPDPVVLKANVDDDATKVKVDTRVAVKASAGTVTKVKLTYKGVDGKGAKVDGSVKGSLSKDRLTWTADDRLEPSATYTLAMTGVNKTKQKQTTTATFKTAKLSLAQQTFASVYPLPDSKVGVGMPLIVNFDVPVSDRAAFEKNLHVTSSPAQKGSWNWLSDREVHFRPKTYWKPGTKVTLDADLNGVNAGNGIYGQDSAATSFTVGREMITRVNLNTDYAKVYRDDKLVRTIAVTGGKPGWATRSGTKLIMAKEYNKVMTNEMIGAKEKYSLTAKYALRVTNSGEFLHAAPWSLANLGVRNASHGCVGMSVDNAGWLYENSLIGDPVVTTGTSKGLEQGNGYADWNISYSQYKKGSAL